MVHPCNMVCVIYKAPLKPINAITKQRQTFIYALKMNQTYYLRNIPIPLFLGIKYCEQLNLSFNIQIKWPQVNNIIVKCPPF